ncbi:MAG: signal peptide peptidase SppA, partial [Cyclobacteriaceae bacterium]|nr:signal peptide peptidase SppA [Cyclobacteriaceae bacterium]
NGTKYAELIRKARENDKVKAIVLRINSPGGQMIASDLIWREVILASEEKPVIASMGDVAASGGYYMAMATDKIVAQKNTITGSIGIFGMLFNMQGFLNNKLGVNVEEVNTGEFSSIFTFSRPLTDIEKEIIQRGTEKGYQTFIENVAEGRGMDIEEVKKVASGRVWSGEQALEMGLVDELGSLSDAIKIAAEMAGIEKYRLNYYPKRKTLLENLMSPDHEVAIQKIQQDLGLPGNTLQKVKSLVSNQGIQARMLFDIELK